MMVNGLDSIALTKLDVLDEMKKIKVCTGYKYNGRVYKMVPADTDILMHANPIYEEHNGWMQDISSVTRYVDLPNRAKSYLARLSELLGVRIGMVSVGTKRRQAFRI